MHYQPKLHALAIPGISLKFTIDLHQVWSPTKLGDSVTPGINLRSHVHFFPLKIDSYDKTRTIWPNDTVKKSDLPMDKGQTLCEMWLKTLSILQIGCN